MRQSFQHIVRFTFVVALVFLFESPKILPAGKGLLAQLTTTTPDRSTEGRQLFDSLFIVKASPSFLQSGKASFYADRFHGRSTANGESFDMDGFTAAHRSLPFGSIVRVYNPENNTAIVVMINDRGPFVGSRVIDMARGAARCIDVSLCKVSLEAFKPKDFASEDTFIGFLGTSYEPYRVQAGALVVSDTLESFSEAVRKHRVMAAKSPETDVFLVVAKIPNPSSSDAELKTAYFIATRKDSNNSFDTASLLTE